MSTKSQNQLQNTQNHTKKLVLAGVLCAVAVIGSTFSFPVFGSKCAPIQHIVNIICAIYLGPVYGLEVAFTASLLRNILALGTLMAFPGSMFGVLLASLLYRYFKKTPWAFLGEVFGTAVLGGITAYFVGVYLMGIPASGLAFYAFILPFFISTGGGAIMCAVFMSAVNKFRDRPIFDAI